jgi:hypothetical protein
MTQFRQVAKLISRDTRQKSWMTTSFERTYHQSIRIANTYHGDESKLQLKLQNIKPSQELIDWCRHGHSKRGLETWSSVHHREARQAVAMNARNRVLRVQEHCDAELIQQISERSTRASRVYARLIGQADADAIVS